MNAQKRGERFWKMFDEELRAICQKLKPLMGTRADALWIAYLTAQTPQAKRETEALIHMVAARYLSSQVDNHKILLPPPSAEAARGEFPLGTINCNTQIYLGLQHEDDIFTAKRSLFLNRGDEVFLDRLAVGEGIVKIKGRVEPCYVKFPLVPVQKGAVTDEDVGYGGDDAAKTGLG